MNVVGMSKFALEISLMLHRVHKSDKIVENISILHSYEV